jgi:hypothetical protein
LKNSAKKLFEFLKFLKNSEKTSFNLKILENNQLSTFPKCNIFWALGCNFSGCNYDLVAKKQKFSRPVNKRYFLKADERKYISDSHSFNVTSIYREAEEYIAEEFINDCIKEIEKVLE